MSGLDLLVSQRKVVRKKVTECYNRVDSFNTFNARQKLSEKGILLNYQKMLGDLDSKIYSLKFTGEGIVAVDVEAELTTCLEYIDKIVYCMSRLDMGNDLPDTGDVARSLLKQPTAPLPKFFSNEGEDLLKFISEFESTTQSFRYPDRDLLLLLRQQVEGRARVLLDSLEADKQTYGDAKDLLRLAFASEDSRKSSVIKKLTELNLGVSDDPFKFISSLRTIRETVKVLKMNADDFLQYFVWLGLNELFKKELIQITTKTYPSIDDMMNNFFIACERYENAKKNTLPCNIAPTTHKQKTASLAAKITEAPIRKKLHCSLCNSNDHTIFQCKKYGSPESKIDRLRVLKGCFKCGNLNHISKECKFDFRHRCLKCSGIHLTCLCFGAAKGNSDGPKDKSDGKTLVKAKKDVMANDVNSGIAVLPTVVNETVLPTFSFSVKGLNGTFRGLKDCGSQSTFVTEHMAGKSDFAVLNPQVKLTIQGFNGTKQYLSRIIELPIELGMETVNIAALVVPSINVSLKLPMLGGIVQTFIDKGYELADKKLSKDSDIIDNVHMLLGSDAFQCIAGRDIIFGHNPPSMFIETGIGVLLVGNVKTLSQNTKFLGSASKVECSKVSLVNGTSLGLCVSPGVQVNTQSFLCNNFVKPFLDDEFKDLHYDVVSANYNINVINNKGQLIQSELQKAAEQILEDECQRWLNYDLNIYDERLTESNQKWVNYALNSIYREKDGRIVVPLLWNSKVSHLLSKNESLSKLILKSNFERLKRKEGHLNLVDQVIKEQVKAGIIERVTDLDTFKAEHPDFSFLPHMAIFKPEKETTKCRVVFLSNLKETVKNKVSLSHNQCIDAGPNLNQKLISAFMHLRFDSYLLTYDLKKAFNMLSLNENDQAKLLFLWYRNISKGDYSIVAYKNLRLSFGLRCSPFLLMISLYYSLVCQDEADPKLKELKLLLYALIYMDNGAISSSNTEYLKWSYSQLSCIFNPYKFETQQVVTNDPILQDEIDKINSTETPVENNLFGIVWNRIEDCICTANISLNPDANTKRKVLQTIASQFDAFGFNIPILNRSRLFMHRLQCMKDLGWDRCLTSSQQREWKNICNQANGLSPVKIKRFVGPRTDKFNLVAFTDSSHELYGTVVYIEHVDSGKMSFLQAKNRMVNKQLRNKSIPSLELNAIALGVETLLDIYQNLAGPSCVKPIDISCMQVYSDSSCALQWLKASECELSKMQGKSVFVLNRINAIRKLCEIHPVKFSFISGKENPADCVTRSLSPKLLAKSCFVSGPTFLPNNDAFVTATIPHPGFMVTNQSVTNLVNDTLLDPAKFSSLRKLILVYRRVLYCVSHWKRKAKIQVNDEQHVNYYAEAMKNVILQDQHIHFGEIFSYFHTQNPRLKDIPPLVSKLNIFVDESGILRVKSKFRTWYGHEKKFPILLSSESSLTNLIIMDIHVMLQHGGCYAVLTELRKRYFIPKHFSVIKRALRQCIQCRRFNSSSIKLNQNCYREFRCNPPAIPFANVFVDYIGPFNVKQGNQSMKVWVLCVSCTWSRAVNLKVCHDLSVKEYLRALQLHSFEYGLPQLCISDLGSQLVAGGNVIKSFINDPETKMYLHSNGIQNVEFQQFFKGHSQLGSMVEICVKMTKKLIFGAIRNLVLSVADFEYLICNTVHLINKRPVAFKECLRAEDANSYPEPITPEMLIKGYELISLNIIPELQYISESDPDWMTNMNPTELIKDEYSKLRKVKHNLIEAYHGEFLRTLVDQAVDRKDRYRPVSHRPLKIGDIVLIKEPYTKTCHYPLGIVKSLETNDLEETTGAVVLKGKTKELVKRHITTLIPYLECNGEESDILPVNDGSLNGNDAQSSRIQRKAAMASRNLTKFML